MQKKIDSCECASGEPICAWCDSLSEFELDNDGKRIPRESHRFEIKQPFYYFFHFIGLSYNRGYPYYWSDLHGSYWQNEGGGWSHPKSDNRVDVYMHARVYWERDLPKRVVESPGSKEPEKEQKTKRDDPYPRDMVEMRAAPNPFTSVARISILVEKDMVGEVAVYNVRGKELAHLYSGGLGKGIHVFGWQPEAGLSSGTYFIKFTTRDFQASQRVVYIR